MERSFNWEIETEWEKENQATEHNSLLTQQKVGGIILLMLTGICIMLSIKVDGDFLTGAVLSCFLGLCAVFGKTEN